MNLIGTKECEQQRPLLTVNKVDRGLGQVSENLPLHLQADKIQPGPREEN